MRAWCIGSLTLRWALTVANLAWLYFFPLSGVCSRRRFACVAVCTLEMRRRVSVHLGKEKAKRFLSLKNKIKYNYLFYLVFIKPILN